MSASTSTSVAGPPLNETTAPHGHGGMFNGDGSVAHSSIKNGSSSKTGYELQGSDTGMRTIGKLKLRAKTDDLPQYVYPYLCLILRFVSFELSASPFRCPFGIWTFDYKTAKQDECKLTRHELSDLGGLHQPRFLL